MLTENDENDTETAQEFEQIELTELEEIVIRQLGYDGKEIAEITSPDSELASTLKDIAEHSADAGWNGFAYHSQTSKFYQDNSKLIIGALRDDAEQFGTSLIKMVASFNCLNSNVTEQEVEDFFLGFTPNTEEGEDLKTTIENALSWYALEECSRSVTMKLDPNW